MQGFAALTVFTKMFNRCIRLWETDHHLMLQLMQGTGLWYLTGSEEFKKLLLVKGHTSSSPGYKNLSSLIAAPVHATCLSSQAVKVHSLSPEVLWCCPHVWMNVWISLGSNQPLKNAVFLLWDEGERWAGSSNILRFRCCMWHFIHKL